MPGGNKKTKPSAQKHMSSAKRRERRKRAAGAERAEDAPTNWKERRFLLRKVHMQVRAMERADAAAASSSGGAEARDAWPIMGNASEARFSFRPFLLRLPPPFSNETARAGLNGHIQLVGRSRR
eukprot:8603769-Alexandrium_andersonii.AAC.1